MYSTAKENTPFKYLQFNNQSIRSLWLGETLELFHELTTKGGQQVTVTELTEKGSACSQVIGEPQEALRDLSGSDSGTINMMKKRLKVAIMVARRITCDWPCWWLSIHVPRDGLTTRLAANVAET